MQPKIEPGRVHELLSRWVLTKGYDLVLDLENSRGSWMVDARNGKRYANFFSFYAALALGFNHPRLNNEETRAMLADAALHKPSNCDVYTWQYAWFVDVFSRLAIRDRFSHLFFIEGGSPAVENALKTAIDWKVKHNLASGHGEKGFQALHFRHCFHGRTGYALSLTDSPDPRKTRHFPRFNWPRVSSPAIDFSLKDFAMDEVREREKIAQDEILDALESNPHDIACIVIEPIQCEGGDRHFRPEFLQWLRSCADDHDVLLVFDEIQTGMGMTGTWWAFEQMGVHPDIISFGKKSRVCGIAAGPRLDVVDSVFRESSRISSTFEGNLVDMVHCARTCQIIEEEGLLAHAARQGVKILKRIQEMSGRVPEVTAARGRGLLAAFDLPDQEIRNQVLNRAFDKGAIFLGCGVRSIRLRPVLDVDDEVIDAGMKILEEAIKETLHAVRGQSS
ncbi:MAG: putative L-lysine-epsilon aminotransferase [Myxococcota bacterium]|nr:putative L-lysine-epsilon aminotransferase [Myxococcota bacterium]